MYPIRRQFFSGPDGHSNNHATNLFYMRWFVYGAFIVFLFIGTKVGAQVNPQNGAAQMNIPLYSYTDAGNRLGLNASLVYIDGNGLKVSEMASPVGTGWVLDCGGSITRVQHGEPDDQKQKGTYGYNGTLADYVNYMNNYYPDGYLNSGFSPTDVIDDQGATEVYTSSLPLPGANGPSTYKLAPYYLADREQDVFAFTFNGRSGQFVIGKNRQVVTLVDSKLKISLQESDMSSSGIRTTISQFTITDESGIQYVFKDLELSYVSTYNDYRRITSDNQNVTTTTSSYYPQSTYLPNTSVINLAMGRPSTQYIVSKWCLSQIINPFTNQQITFNYDTYERDINTDLLINYLSYAGQTGRTANALWQKLKAKARRLTSVTLSSAETLNFVYSSAARVDQPAEPSLESLNVTYKGNLVYGWKFGLGYIIGNQRLIRDVSDPHIYTDAEKHWARLALLTLQKTGTNGAAEPPYKFSYNLGGDITGLNNDYVPAQFSLHKDHFGYYNPLAFYGTSEGYETSFYVMTDIYSAAAAPSGSGPHTPWNNFARNGILSSITYPMGGILSYTYEANSTSSMQLGGVRVATTTQYDGISHANDIVRQYKYINTDGTSSGWGGEAYTYATTYTLLAPTCGGGNTPAGQEKAFAMNIVMQAFPGSSLFQSLASFDNSSCISFNDIYQAVLGGLIGGNSNPTSLSITSSSNYSNVADNLLPWGYGRTEVTTLLSADNVGKTVYEFTTPQTTGVRPIDVPTVNVPNSSRPRYVPWIYGLPTTTAMFDKAGNQVKQTVNHYSFIINSLQDGNFLSRSWAAIEKSYVCGLLTGPASTQGMISQETYSPFNTQHAQTTVTTYYEYDNNYQLKHRYFSNSKNERIDNYNYYLYNYSLSSGPAIAMVTSNIISPVVSTETYITKGDGNMYMISGVSTDFGYISDGDIKPRATYTFQSSLPIAKTSMQPFNISSVVRDPLYFKQTALYDYDSKGNLVQTLTGGNNLFSTVYDYDGRLPIATVSNASYNDIGYMSFEAEGNKTGDWINSAAVIADDARTGNHCFNLSDPSNGAAGYFGFSGLNRTLAYVVSFWGKNCSVKVTGCQGAVCLLNGYSAWKQGTTVNGWTYYEQVISGGFDKLQISGTGLVDEFRVYPVGAQMKTTTYAPLIGKTSECDASGRIRYYLYDDLGRLIKISDDQRNVLRTYEYNYKQ